MLSPVRLLKIIGAFTAFTAGCFEPPDRTGRACSDPTDCSGLPCLNGICQLGVDASPLDAGELDAAEIDADVNLDAGALPDAGPSANCGDGDRSADEECDDGRQDDGDGCSASCTLEAGWRCETDDDGASVCSAECGDRVRLGRETCDDGNIRAADGCSSTCRVEPGFVCPGIPSTCRPADSDLALHIDLDSSQGSFAPDVSGQGFDGVIEPPPAQWGDGAVRGGVRLDGGRGVVVPDVSYGSAFTVLFWTRVELDSIADRVTLVDHGFSTNGMGYRLSAVGTGRLDAHVRWSAAEARLFGISAALHDLRAWHQVALVVRTNGRLTLYLDGAYQAEIDGAALELDPEASISLGRESGLAGSEMIGSIDEFRVFRRALTQGEIFTLYRSEGGQGPIKVVARADASVRGGAFGDTNENMPTVQVKISTNPDFNWESYFRYDVSGITGFSAARLNLFMGVAGLPDLVNGVGLVSDDSWSETGLTWNSRPAAGADIQTWTVPTARGWLDVDLTQTVTVESAADGQVSLRVRSLTDVGDQSFVFYRARESADQPHLELRF